MPYEGEIRIDLSRHKNRMSVRSDKHSQKLDSARGWKKVAHPFLLSSS